MSFNNHVIQGVRAIAQLFGISYTQVPAELHLQTNTAYHLKISSGILVTRFCTPQNDWHIVIVIPVPLNDSAQLLYARFVEYCYRHSLSLVASRVDITQDARTGPYLVTFEVREEDLITCPIKDHFCFELLYTSPGGHSET
ncbi:MAG: hypothetical protein UZ21_OP11001001177 [Microgenomates bacterium OLB22]|nr:MAG: hypothetical protein UZ21_OP11001001177 [Microgenomates bacterium OLB22]